MAKSGFAFWNFLGFFFFNVLWLVEIVDVEPADMLG